MYYMKIEVTPLERKLLEEVIRPALSEEEESFDFFFFPTRSQTLDFKELLLQVKNLYRPSGKDWKHLVIETL